MLRKKNYFVLLIPFILLAQEQKQKYFKVDELLPAIVYLKQDSAFVIKENGQNVKKNKTKSGTGFLVYTEKNLFLVTASHVAKSMLNTSILILRDTTGSPIILKTIELVQDTTLNWTHHKEADVAVLKLNPPVSLINSVLQKRFIPSYIINPEFSAPLRNNILTIIGYPLSLGIGKKISALTLQTHSASDLLELKRSDTNKYSTFFICENPSIGGYSGAPCFDISIYELGAMTSTGNGTICYGLMHGTISDDTGGKLSAVVPSKYILELIK